MMATTSTRSVQSVYRRLLEAIEHGEYPVRSFLPPSRALCQEYGVSRPTLGKAVARLAAEGRLRTRQGAGTVVLGTPAASGTRIVSLMSITNDALLVQAQRRALGLGFLLNLFLHQETSWDPRLERRFLQCVKEQRSQALLAFCSPLAPTNDDLLAEVAAAGVRVIHIEAYRPALPAQEYLLPDYRRAGHLAAVKLLLAGCRGVRMVSHWGAPSPSTLLIEQGLAETVEEHLGPYCPAAARLELRLKEAYENGVVRRELAGLPAATGLVYTSLHCAGLARQFLAEAGREEDARRVVGIATVQAKPLPPVDCLVFDSVALLDRVFDELVRPDAEPLHELVKPVWMAAAGTPLPAEAAP